MNNNRFVCITGNRYAVYERIWHFKDGMQHAGSRCIAIYNADGENKPSAADVEKIRVAQGIAREPEPA